MSNIMWNRVHKLEIKVQPEERKRLDKEFEKDTGKDCDEAAKTMSDSDFRRAIERSLQRIRKRSPLEIAA